MYVFCYTDRVYILPVSWGSVLKHIIVAHSFLFCLFLFGCGISNYDRGQDFLAQGELKAAADYFTAAADENVGQDEAHRELGITYYRGRFFPQAVTHLQIASQTLQDERTALYLGMALENGQQYDQAIAAYERFVNLNDSPEIVYQTQARLVRLRNQYLTQLAENAVQNEAQIDLTTIPTNSVAVFYFELLSGRDGLRPLQKALTDLIISDLNKVSALQVIPRLDLQRQLDQMQLQQDSVFNQASQERIGRLLGASKVCTGTIEGLAELDLRLNANVIDSRKVGQVEPASVQQGPEADFFELQKEMVSDILDALGVEATSREKRAIKRQSTRSLPAVIAYGRGLDASDKYDLELAEQHLQLSLKEDPAFQPALDQLNYVRLMAVATNQSLDEIDKLVTDGTKFEKARQRRLNRMNRFLSRQFAPPAAADAPREGDIDPPQNEIQIVITN